MNRLRWYVLTARAGTERATALAVKRVGADGLFVPGVGRWVRKSRHVRGRSTHVRKIFPALPGYVFAGFADYVLNTRGWDPVLELDLVQGVIHETTAAGRRPLEIGGDWRRAIRDMAILSQFENLVTAKDPEQGEDPDKIAVGDQVVVTHAAFDRYPGKCVQINGDVATVLMHFFGAERRVPAPLAALVRAEKPGTS